MIGFINLFFRSCMCCINPSHPNQPVNPQLSSGSRNVRCFNTEWYKRFPWIHVCLVRKRVFCFYCLVAYCKELLTLSKPHKTAFFVEGFQNWKKGLERFQVHEAADCHKEAVLKVRTLSLPTVVEQLSSVAEKTRVEHRNMLLKVFSSLRFLVRQGLPLRGHREEEGNLLQLLYLRSEDDPQLARWVKTQDYLSPTIVNEM